MSGIPTANRTPRLSGLPTPNRGSGIPAPGRPRSSISNGPRQSMTKEDDEVMRASLAAAVKAKPPSDYLNGPSVSLNESTIERTPAPRKSIGPRTSSLTSSTLRAPRPPSSASQASHTSGRLQIPEADSPNSFQTAFSTPLHTPGGIRARTPSGAYAPRMAATSAYPTHRRPESRQSVGSTTRSVSRLGQLHERSASRTGRPFEVGDKVRLESKGWEGILRYLGEVHFRDGIWAGVELLPGFAGKGKNDGSVEGKRYFDCPPNMGVFISADKLSAPAPSYARPPSSASVTSRTGRITPFKEPPTPELETPSAMRSRVQAAAAASRISVGSRASKFLRMTAQQLREAGIESQPHPDMILESPIRSPNRPPTLTPKSAGRQSFGMATPGSARSRASLGGPTPKARPRNADMSVPMSPPLTLPALSAGSTSANTSLQEEDIVTPEESHTLESGTRAFQERVAKLMSEDLGTSRSPVVSAQPAGPTGFMEESPLALRTSARLVERVEMLEQENKRLKADALRSTAPSPSKSHAAQSLITDLQQRLESSERITADIQQKLHDVEKQLEEQVSLRESEKEQAADVLSAADERVDEAEKKAAALIGELDSFKKKLAEVERDRDEKVQHIQELERRVVLLEQQANEEREDLLQQVEELRKAGQETIAFYEEHKAAHEADRYELEQQIQALEEQLRSMPESAGQPSSALQQTETATQIDNEALREQVAHYQSRITKLEDQLEDAQADRLKQEEAYRARIQKAKDQEANWRKEFEKVRQEMDDMKKAEQATRGRIEELEVALRESDEALENARAEIESLRTDVTDRAELRESASQMTKASAKQSEELERLREQLEKAERARDDAQTLCNTLKQEVEAAAHTIAELRARKEAMEKERAADYDNTSLGPPTDERRRESNGSDMSKSRRSTTDPEKELRDQIKGLKHMVQELQKENAALASQKRMLEADNKALAAEAEDLKEEIKGLEEAVEKTIQQEEEALAQDTKGPAGPNDVSIAELRAKHAAELRQLNDKLKEKETTIRNLNKEMADYESLIESKIYEEDDYTRKIATLEGQVKQLKDKLSRASHSSRSSETSFPTRNAARTISEETTCDLCGERDHDFTSCPQLNGNTQNGVKSAATSKVELYCADCETFGHATKDCPHSQDVF